MAFLVCHFGGTSGTIWDGLKFLIRCDFPGFLTGWHHPIFTLRNRMGVNHATRMKVAAGGGLARPPRPRSFLGESRGLERQRNDPSVFSEPRALSLIYVLVLLLIPLSEKGRLQRTQKVNDTKQRGAWVSPSLASWTLKMGYLESTKPALEKEISNYWPHALSQHSGKWHSIINHKSERHQVKGCMTLVTHSNWNIWSLQNSFFWYFSSLLTGHVQMENRH